MGERNEKIKLPAKIKSVLRGTSLIIKMLLLAIVVGVAVWIILDHIQSRRLKAVFTREVVKELGEQAHDDWLRMDYYIRFHSRTGKLITLQKPFNDYLEKSQWSAEDTFQIKYYRQLPPWFPGASVMRTLANPRYALLFDGQRRVREVYQGGSKPVPVTLLQPTNYLFQTGHNQYILTLVEGFPYLISAETISNPQGKLRATLMVASPLDDEFLIRAQGFSAQGRVIAFISGEEPHIIASNHPGLIPAGTQLDALRDRYIMTRNEFFDYGSSDLVISIASFVSTEKVEAMTRIVLNQDRRNGTIAAFVFILSFTLIIYWITKDIRKLTRFVVDFEQKDLGFKPSAATEGDELQILKERFHSLTEEVLLSREIIKKESMEALKESENRFRLLMEQSPFSIELYDTDGNWLRANKAWEELWQLEPIDAFGKFNLLSDKQANEKGIAEYFKKAVGGESVQLPDLEYDAVKAVGKGRSRWLRTSFYPIKDTDNHVQNIVITHQDITDRMQAEEALQKAGQELEKRVEERTIELKAVHEQLLHAEKLSALGKLSASIAHEFNNPIFGIKLILEELEQKPDLDETERKSIKLAIKETDRIARLTRNLLEFYRPSSGAPVSLDVHQAIEDVLEICGKRFMVSGIRIEKDFAPELPRIFAIPDQLKQVFLNLVTNAEEAMTPSAGILTIQTKTQGDKVHIAFKDNGAGIPKENLPKVFDPFFTTKKAVKGTGLGLSISYGIIKRHGGNILVESAPNKGSVFTIELPLKKAKIASFTDNIQS